MKEEIIADSDNNGYTMTIYQSGFKKVVNGSFAGVASKPIPPAKEAYFLAAVIAHKSGHHIIAKETEHTEAAGKFVDSDGYPSVDGVFSVDAARKLVQGLGLPLK